VSINSGKVHKVTNRASRLFILKLVDKGIFYDKRKLRGGSPNKAKPQVKTGRKAAGLKKKMAELPKDMFSVCSAFRQIP